MWFQKRMCLDIQWYLPDGQFNSYESMGKRGFKLILEDMIQKSNTGIKLPTNDR